jgi:exodeoxyribonuclease V alpha subunit
MSHSEHLTVLSILKDLHGSSSICIPLSHLRACSDSYFDKALHFIQENNFCKLAEGCIYDPKNYFDEKTVVDFILKLMDMEPIFNKGLVHQTYQMANKEQIAGLESLRQSNLATITGGPGTGKSTCSKLSRDIASSDGKGVLIPLAPTGKAKVRLDETLDMHLYGSQPFVRKAMTLSKFIYECKSEADFLHHSEDSKFLFLLDEFSMITLSSFASFCRQVISKFEWGSFSLLLSGDPNQLPATGIGAILRDLLRSKSIPHTILTRNYRQRSVPNICRLLSVVLEGKSTECIPTATVDLNWIKKEFMKKSGKIYEIIDILPKDLLQSLATPKSIFIVATNQERNFVNEYLRQLLNPSTVVEPKSKHLVFRAYDRFIVIKNYYPLEIFNGMTGTIKSSTSESRYDYLTRKYIKYTILHVIFDRDPNERTLEFLTSDHILFDLGYAITVHKSQGSEYENVIVSLPYFFKMITREFLYTVFSRSTKTLLIYATEKTIAMGIANPIKDRVSRIVECVDSDVHMEIAL